MPHNNQLHSVVISYVSNSPASAFPFVGSRHVLVGDIGELNSEVRKVMAEIERDGYTAVNSCFLRVPGHIYGRSDEETAVALDGSEILDVVLEAIRQEIGWCRAHYQQHHYSIAAVGHFISGLEQALNLVRAIQERYEEGVHDQSNG